MRVNIMRSRLFYLVMQDGSVNVYCTFSCCLVECDAADSTVCETMWLHCFLKCSPLRLLALRWCVRKVHRALQIDWYRCLIETVIKKSLRSRWLQRVKHPCKSKKGVGKYLSYWTPYRLRYFFTPERACVAAHISHLDTLQTTLCLA